ncbi:MAG TPA: ABC transporter substrate-binding protein [Herpetosiphonaceae bacterium]
MRRIVSLSLLLILAACGGVPTDPTSTPTTTTADANTGPQIERTATSVAGSPAAAATTDAPIPTATTARPTPAPKPTTNVLTVKLRPGLTWSDGSPLTTQDLAGTYDLYWATQNGSWDFLNDVSAKDDTTVEFQLTTPSLSGLRLLLRTFQPAPRSQYARWMDQARTLRQQSRDPERDEVKQLVDDLYAFKPDEAVVYGPYKLDPASITEAQLQLVKNPGGYNADTVGFERLIVYQGETAASVPLMLAGQLDYSTHAYTPSDLAAFAQVPGVQIIRGPNGTGPGLWFNQSVAPLNRKEVRQAFAHIIDRQENAKVALGDAAQPIERLAGFPDAAVDQWLSPEAAARLNGYPKDHTKAESLLAGLGFTKNESGTWTDEQNNPLAFELSVPADFTDWLAAAENAAQQLSAFGIPTTVRGYQSAERADIQKQGRYQILMDLSTYYIPPYPFASYRYMLDAPRNAPTSVDTGMNWSWDQTTPDGKVVNVVELIDGAATGLDLEAQKPYVEQLALLVNTELPILPLFERYSTDPINTVHRVTGWLPLDHPIYQNNQGSDNYISIQLLDGTLKPAAGADGSFRTSFPYPQPPNYDLNFFSASSLTQSLGYPASDLLYPPLFWYMFAEQEYAPEIAESYELRDAQ